jgi:hypothetical protein
MKYARMRRLLPAVLLGLLLLAACGSTATPATGTPVTEAAATATQPPPAPSGPAGKCGDGTCDEAEQANPDLCPQDCATPTTAAMAPTAEPVPTQPAPVQGRCGDGACDGPENGQNCPQDCGDYGGMHTPAPFAGRCGDGTCDGPENQDNCPQDCDVVAAALTEDECWSKETLAASTATSFAETVDPGLGSPDSVLYIGIVVHIEPQESYLQEPIYRQDAQRLRRVAEIVAAHGGRMTVQTQPPFLDVAESLGDPIHQDLAAMDNEIALHLHEDEYVGRDSDNLPVEDYARAMTELKVRIEQVSGAPVTNWAGGNTYVQMWEAAAQAGYRTNCNYKNRYTQSSAPGFAVVNPWRPAGAENEMARVAHDPNGPIIYVPSGVYPVHCTRLEAVPRPYGHEAFDYVTRALRASLASATPGMVNTFYLTFHPGDFLAPEDDEQDLVVWDAWLTEIVDPLVAVGRLEWATIGEMATAFEAWEAGQ